MIKVCEKDSVKFTIRLEFIIEQIPSIYFAVYRLACSGI